MTMRRGGAFPTVWRRVRRNARDPRAAATLGAVVYLTALKWIYPYYEGKIDIIDRLTLLVSAAAFAALPWPRAARVTQRWIAPLYFLGFFLALFVLQTLLFDAPAVLVSVIAAGALLAADRWIPRRIRPVAVGVLCLGLLSLPLWRLEFDTWIAPSVLTGLIVTVLGAPAASFFGWWRSRPALWAAALTLALVMPYFTMAKHMPHERLGRKLAERPYIELLFAPRDPLVPRAYNQLLDPGVEGRLFVMPHKEGAGILALNPDGSTRFVDTGGQVADTSAVKNGVVYTVRGRTLISIDARTLEVHPLLELGPENPKDHWDTSQAYQVLIDGDDRRLFVSWDLASRQCVVVDLETMAVVARLPQPVYGTCEPVDDDREIVVSGWMPPWWVVTFYDAVTYEPRRTFRHLGSFARNAAYDQARRRLVTLGVLESDLNLRDLETFRRVRTRIIGPGWLTMTVDPKAPLLYLSHYYTGTVRVLNAETLETLTQIRLGSILHNTTVSHDGRYLLAATSAGGFRIDLDAWLAGEGIRRGD
ncbi:MAG: hypothetical protein M5R36_15910 [Deltaproteobacteria bacterium]|nr:hypothetical protein [Deltaproteobacteria bacterium]